MREKLMDEEQQDALREPHKSIRVLSGEEARREDLREKIAERVHIVWQRWMAYMLSHFDEAHLDRWRRQANTKYEDLPEHEKESDRAIAREYLTLICQEIERAGVISEGEIRAKCLGEGVYWAGELRYEVATDPVPVLMPQFKRVIQAELAHILKIFEEAI